MLCTLQGKLCQSPILSVMLAPWHSSNGNNRRVARLCETVLSRRAPATSIQNYKGRSGLAPGTNPGRVEAENSGVRVREHELVPVLIAIRVCPRFDQWLFERLGTVKECFKVIPVAHWVETPIQAVGPRGLISSNPKMQPW